MLRFVDDVFDPEQAATIGKFFPPFLKSQILSLSGVDFRVTSLAIDGNRVKLAVWDTAGQERFRTLTPSYYRGAQGVICVYDVTSRSSFEKMAHWMTEVDTYCTNENIIKMVVANKIDMVGARRNFCWNLRFPAKSRCDPRRGPEICKTPPHLVHRSIGKDQGRCSVHVWGAHREDHPDARSLGQRPSVVTFGAADRVERWNVWMLIWNPAEIVQIPSFSHIFFQNLHIICPLSCRIVSYPITSAFTHKLSINILHLSILSPLFHCVFFFLSFQRSDPDLPFPDYSLYSVITSYQITRFRWLNNHPWKTLNVNF